MVLPIVLPIVLPVTANPSPGYVAPQPMPGKGLPTPIDKKTAHLAGGLSIVSLLATESSHALAFRELERLTRLDLAVLLAFDGPTVTGQEALLLENAAKIRLIIGQRL